MLRGAWKLIGGNPTNVYAEFSNLSLAVFVMSVIAWHRQKICPHLEFKTWPMFLPTSLICPWCWHAFMLFSTCTSTKWPNWNLKAWTQQLFYILPLDFKHTNMTSGLQARRGIVRHKLLSCATLIYFNAKSAFIKATFKLFNQPFLFITV